MKINALIVSLVLVLSGTIALAALAADGKDSRGRSAATAGKRPLDLKARGRVSGLYPGAVKTTAVRIRNNYPAAVRLGFVKTRARKASPGCKRRNLAIAKMRRTKIQIPSHARRVVRVKIGMAPDAPDECQGARFPLYFKLGGKRG